MPIVINRKSGEILANKPFTPAQNQRAHELVIAEEIKRHPERFGMDSSVKSKSG